MNTRFINLIRVAGSPKVTVIGDLILDIYLKGEANRISPEAPIQVLDVQGERFSLGGAANVALNLHNLGADVSLCGVVGNDANGEQLRVMLHEQGIRQTGLIIDETRPTINKTRVIARNQQLVRIDREICSALDKTSEEALLDSMKSLVEKSDLVILSDYGKGAISPDLIQRIDECSKADILVDPKGMDFTKYRGCRLITPNRKEAEQATGIALQSNDDLDKAAASIFDEIGARELLITLGADGIFYARAGGNSQIVPARARSVYDVTGAGDTVIATLGFCMAAGMDFDDAVRIANAAAGIVVGRLGVAAPKKEEIIDFFGQGFTVFKEKILTLPEAVETAGNIRKKGELMVFTNGCFDLIHAGHVSYLRTAKGLGDYLIVGINDDESVARLKGPGRPILSLQERMEIMASLQVVDMVVPFSEDTPLELIQALTPQILVKGEDWREKGVVGREWVESHGGDVVLVPLRPGYSTTSVIDRIAKRYGGNQDEPI